jgi:hypothetical protein
VTWAVCTQCRRSTERTLPSRFPHVCGRCRFPVFVTEAPYRADPPSFFPKSSLVDQLDERNTILGAIAPGERRIS